MNVSENRASSIADQKQKIRERYKGIDSTAAVRKIKDCREVELLIHPGEKRLAVRSAAKGDKKSIVWSRDDGMKISPKIVSGAAFLPTIFSILGWERDCKYRIVGCYREHEGARMLLFDLKDAEMLIPSNLLEHDETGIPLSFLGSRKQVIAYPEVWKEGFGDGYYKQRKTAEDTVDTWAIDIVGTPVSTREINVKDSETLKGEIHKLINEMENENGQ